MSIGTQAIAEQAFAEQPLIVASGYQILYAIGRPQVRQLRLMQVKPEVHINVPEPAAAIDNPSPLVHDASRYA